MTGFRDWLAAQTQRNDEIGELARDVAGDDCLPPDADIAVHWVESHTDRILYFHEALAEAEVEHDPTPPLDFTGPFGLPRSDPYQRPLDHACRQHPEHGWWLCGGCTPTGGHPTCPDGQPHETFLPGLTTVGPVSAAFEVCTRCSAADYTRLDTNN